MRIFALQKLFKHTKTANSMHNIGQKVKELREKRNYTQEYMAEQLGITQGSYSKIEQNKSNPPISRLLKIAAILEISTAEYIELVGANERTIFTNNNYKKTTKWYCSRWHLAKRKRFVRKTNCYTTKNY